MKMNKPEEEKKIEKLNSARQLTHKQDEPK